MTTKIGEKLRNILQWVVLDMMPLFRLSPLEKNLLHFVVRRTLGWGKIEEHIPMAVLIGGLRGKVVQLAGVGCCDRFHLWRTRNALVEKGLLFCEERGKQGRNSQWYRVNVPGMWLIWNQWLSLGGAETKDARDRIEEAVESVKRIYIKKGWKLQALAKEAVMGMEEEIDRARRNSELANERRKERRAKEGPLRQQWVLPLMGDICEELGCIHEEGLLSGQEVKQLKGSIRNWLEYCTREGVDPRKRMRDVCENWTYFAQGELKRDNGTDIMLPLNVVSFTQYFVYRRPIDRWLLENAGTEHRAKWNVVEFKGKRPKRKELGLRND